MVDLDILGSVTKTKKNKTIMRKAPKMSLLGITACTALESKCTYVRNKVSWLYCYMKQVHWDMVLRRKE